MRNTIIKAFLATLFFLGLFGREARAYYDPGAQRWINRDPIGEHGGVALYRFVKANPPSFQDAWGLRDCPTNDTKCGSLAGDEATVSDGTCVHTCSYTLDDNNPTIKSIFDTHKGPVFLGDDSSSGYLQIRWGYTTRNGPVQDAMFMTMPCDQPCPNNLYCGPGDKNKSKRSGTELVW